MVRVNEVFREADPTITLVDRSDAHELKRITKELNEGGRIVRLHGPSKSGKTVLCGQVLEGKDPLLVFGSDISKKDDLWEAVARMTKVAAPEAPAYCAKASRPVIIEDFHWIDKSVQGAIIKSFKPLLDRGGTAILISVPDVAEVFLDRAKGDTKTDAILGDLLARSVPVQAPLWSEGEVRQIADKGFTALNIRLPAGIMAVLTRFALRNPLLMQKHCSELCFEMDLTQSAAAISDRAPTRENLVSVFKRVAAQNSKFFSGIVNEGGRKPYTLHTGVQVNLNTLLLYVISWVGINQKVGMPRVLKRAREVTANASSLAEKDAITKDAIKTAFQEMIASMRRSGQSGLVMDENDFLYIAHPFFKTFLLWQLIPQCGGETPDLDRYMEAEDQ